MIGKSMIAVGHFLGTTLITLLIYLGGFFLTSYILLEKRAWFILNETILTNERGASIL